MITNDGGFSAYVNEASQINNNLQRYRSDLDNVKIANKEIKQQFEAKTDLDALRTFAGEVGAKSVKDVLSKYAPKLYDVKIGGKSLRERDIELSSNIEEKLSEFSKNKIKEFSDFLDRQQGLNEERQQLQKTENFLKERTGTNTTETIGNKNVYNSITDEDLDIQPQITRIANEEAEASKPQFMENEINEIGDSGEGLGLSSKLQEGVDTLDEGVKGAVDKVNTSIGDSVTSSGTSSGEVISDAVGDVSEKLGASAVEEGVGTALEATGVGAIVGVPLQVAGLVADGGLLYEAGKSLVDWFEEDILGNKPQVPKNQLVQNPVRPMTIAEKHLGVIPNVDTIDTQPSYTGGW